MEQSRYLQAFSEKIRRRLAVKGWPRWTKDSMKRYTFGVRMWRLCWCIEIYRDLCITIDFECGDAYLCYCHHLEGDIHAESWGNNNAGLISKTGLGCTSYFGLAVGSIFYIGALLLMRRITNKSASWRAFGFWMETTLSEYMKNGRRHLFYRNSWNPIEFWCGGAYIFFCAFSVGDVCSTLLLPFEGKMHKRSAEGITSWRVSNRRKILFVIAHFTMSVFGEF